MFARDNNNGIKLRPALLLLSSGLDSAANIPLAPSLGYVVTHALTVDYDQRSAAREIQKSSEICSIYSIQHTVFQIKNFSLLLGASGGGALLSSNKPLPHLKQHELDDLNRAKKSAERVWVPNRNGVLINLAAAFAEAHGIEVVLVGFNREEAATFPDNTAEFAEACSNALFYSTSSKVRVRSATVNLTKSDIVQQLAEKNFPFSSLWSCYQAGELHCGQCESCARLRRAIEYVIQQPTLNSSSRSTLQKALRGLFGHTEETPAPVVFQDS